MSRRRKHTPQGDTPGKPQKKKASLKKQNDAAPGTSRKSLSFSEVRSSLNWEKPEDKDLIKYFCLRCVTWPTHKDPAFWKEAKNYVNSRHNKKRSETGCRKHMFVLKGIYTTLENAKEELNAVTAEDIFKGNVKTGTDCKDVSVEVLQLLIKGKQSHEIMDILEFCFNLILLEENLDVDSDFIIKSINAMHILAEGGCHNTMYDMCTAIASEKMKLDRMPFPLLEANAAYFAGRRVHIRKEYRLWLETMYVHFGEKFIALFCGPNLKWVDTQEDEVNEEEKIELAQVDVAGSEEEEDKVDEDDSEDETHLEGEDETHLEGEKKEEGLGRESTLWANIDNDEVQYLKERGASAQMSSKLSEQMQAYKEKKRKKKNKARPQQKEALVNIVGMSSRQLRRYIAKANFSTGSDIQMSMLKSAHEATPKAHWWIKADACDIKKGIRESMRHKWSGDVDMGDGQVQVQHKNYIARLDQIKKLRKEDLDTELTKLEGDITKLEAALKEASSVRAKKEDQPGISKTKLLEYIWNEKEYELLIKKNNNIQTAVNIIIKGARRATTSLAEVRVQLQEYEKMMQDKKRVAATHLLIFMISDERRCAKPYALPVRFMPVTCITDNKMRDLCEELINAMSDIGMTAVGFSTDGEWNSLRTKGSSRPLQLIELVKQSRNEAAKLKAENVRALFQPTLVGNNWC